MADLSFDLSQLTRAEHFPHLTQFEWEALGRMAEAAGPLAVKALLRSGDAEAQRLAAQEFMIREIDDARAQAQTLARQKSSPRVEPLKIDTSKYGGDEKTPLRRWFCELDEAIDARLIVDEEQRIRYAMSQLTGKVKTWAYGLRSADRKCFRSLEDFKSKLQSTFELPQSEFRMRAEFLSAKQGNTDLHSYIQRMRYLASCVVGKPTDMATQVAMFMTGLRDGPAKTQHFRTYRDEGEKMTIRLADGRPREVPKHSVHMKYVLGGSEKEDVFFAIDMDKRFDCIFGLPWFERHELRIDWKSRSVKSVGAVASGTIDDEAFAVIDEVWWMNMSVCSSAATTAATESDGPVGADSCESTSSTPVTDAPSMAPSTRRRRRARRKSVSHAGKRKRLRAKRARAAHEASVDYIVDAFLAEEEAQRGGSTTICEDDAGLETGSQDCDEKPCLIACEDGDRVCDEKPCLVALEDGEEDILAAVYTTAAPAFQRIRVSNPPVWQRRSCNVARSR